MLTASAAAPRQQQQHSIGTGDEAAAVASTSGRDHRQHQRHQQPKAGQIPSIGSAVLEAVYDAAFAPVPDARKQQYANVQPLPHKNYGNLRGGQYPFLYDPVYGLPVIHDVAKYGEVLRDIRTGLVQEVLWFFDPGTGDTFHADGRCLIRYKDGRVKQSVVPLNDFRVPYAMQAHGVKVGVKAWGAGGATPPCKPVRVCSTHLPRNHCSSILHVYNLHIPPQLHPKG